MFTKTADAPLISVTSVDTEGTKVELIKCDKCGALVPKGSVDCPVCKATIGGNN